MGSGEQGSLRHPRDSGTSGSVNLSGSSGLLPIQPPVRIKRRGESGSEVMTVGGFWGSLWGRPPGQGRSRPGRRLLSSPCHLSSPDECQSSLPSTSSLSHPFDSLVSLRGKWGDSNHFCVPVCPCHCLLCPCREVHFFPYRRHRLYAESGWCTTLPEYNNPPPHPTPPPLVRVPPDRTCPEV